jgi:hypothetical protein
LLNDYNSNEPYAHRLITRKSLRTSWAYSPRKAPVILPTNTIKHYKPQINPDESDGDYMSAVRMNPRVKGAKDTYKRQRRTGEQLFQSGFEDAREGLPAMSNNKHYMRGYKSKSGTNFKARKYVPGAAKRKAMIAAEDARYAASIAKERAVGAAYRKKHPVVYDDRETFHHEYAVKPIWDVPVTRSVSPRTGMVGHDFPPILPVSKRSKKEQKLALEAQQDFYRYNPRVKGAKDTYKRVRRTAEELWQSGKEDAREGLPQMSKNKHYFRGYISAQVVDITPHKVIAKIPKGNKRGGKMPPNRAKVILPMSHSEYRGWPSPSTLPTGTLTKKTKAKSKKQLALEAQQDFYRYNPIRHITKRGQGRPTTAWWILDLYSARGKKISTIIGQGSKAKSTSEAKSFINKSYRGYSVAKVELAGPYSRQPNSKTVRK